MRGKNKLITHGNNNRRNDKKRSVSGTKRFVILGLACAVLLAGGFILSTSLFNYHSNAEADVWDADKGFVIPASNEEASLGSEENPFVVLEIVPHESMASFGYLVGGQEPVDVMKAIENGKYDSIKDYIDKVEGVQSIEFQSIVDTRSEEDRSKYSSLGYTDIHYGEFKPAKKDNNGKPTGNYELVETQVEEAVSDDGNTVVDGGAVADSEYCYVGAGKGDYTFNEEHYVNAEKYVEGTQYYRLNESTNDNDSLPPVATWKPIDYKIPGENETLYSCDYRYTKAADIAIYKYYDNKYVTEDYYNNNIKNNDNLKKLYSPTFTSVNITYDSRDNNSTDNNSENNFSSQNVNKYRLYTKEGDNTYTYVGENKGDYIKVNKKVKYKYTMEFRGDGKSNYDFEGFSYVENNKLTENLTSDQLKEQYTWSRDTSIVSDTKIDYEGKVFKGFITDSLMATYEVNDYQNKELFKKFGLGLAYKDNDISKGEEVSSFEFLGWYYDKYGVNIFDPNRRIGKDTKIYAKWKVNYTTESVKYYKVTFDKNLETGADPNEIVFNMTGDSENPTILDTGIVDVPQGSLIASPMITPKRAGYKFTGWYKDAACMTAFDFNSSKNKINADTTLYAGWVKDEADVDYKVSFYANTGDPFEDENIEVPASFTGLKINGMMSDLTIRSVFEPKRDGYTFNGWYLNKKCTNMYNFGEDLPETITGDSVKLYAGWSKDDEDKGRVITLVANEPSVAINTAEVRNKKSNNLVASITSDLDGYLDFDKLMNLGVSLDSNIEAKLRNYHVKVITITPRDLRSGKAGNDIAYNNKLLIDRANFIVVNESTDWSFVTLWKDYRNKTLFCKDGFTAKVGATNTLNKKYDFMPTDEATFYSTYNFDKADCDFDWHTSNLIWKRMSVGIDGDNKKVAPILIDYKVYSDVTKYTATDKMYTQTRTFSDGGTLDFSEKTQDKYGASKNNAYKLYLETQQMNPVTLYRAYMKYLVYPDKVTNDKYPGNFCGTNNYMDNNDNGYYRVKGQSNAAYWNDYTLAPFEAMSEEEYNTYGENGTGENKNMIYKMLGFNNDLSLAYSTVSYRSMVLKTKDSTKNITLLDAFVDRITKQELRLDADDDMKDYMDNKNISDENGRYKITDGIYYLLHSKATTTNVTRNINILEIEPSSDNTAYKSDVYWYWYIARSIDNFTGRVNVTKQSTYEFVGNIEDLNAKYDIIFVGGNDTNLATFDKRAYDGMPEYKVGSKTKKYIYAHSGKCVQNQATERAGGLLDN